MSLLHLDGVHSYYGHIHALKGISLTVEEGEIVTLIGSNGAGKSTTLRTISGMIHPQGGQVRFDDRDISRLEPHDIVLAGLGHVPEGRGIFPKLTVRENLEMGAFTVNDPQAVRERMASGFELFPRLKERVGQYGGTLSGGEQQMLAMARGLATDPALLIIDELSMGLAPLIVGELYEIVAGIANDGVSVLVVEQFARTVLGVADRAVIMQHGHVIAAGVPADLEAELSAAYLGASS